MNVLQIIQAIPIPQIVVLFLLIVASVFFVAEWLRADLVALLLLTLLGVTGILTPQETLSGFSRSAVITILAIFIVTAGLAKTGATRAFGAGILRWSGRSEKGLLAVLMAAAAFLSLFMNNIAAASVLLPVAIGISREREVSPSKLMMPLAFGTLLGGTATLLTTSNILVSAVLRDANYAPFSLLDFAPVGIPLIILGIAYMVFVGRGLLPRRAPTDWERMMTASRVKLADVYGLSERWMSARVPPNSPLIGRTLYEAGLGSELGVNVIAMMHNGRSRFAPPPSDRLYQGQILYLQAREEQVEALRKRGLDVLRDSALIDNLTSGTVGLSEVILGPRSSVLGKTIREIHFREKFGLNVVAIWREGRPRRVGIGEIPLQYGDALLVLGPKERMRVLQAEGDFIVLTEVSDEGLRKNKSKLAVGVMVAVIILAATGLVATAEAMLVGALAMVLIGALTMDEAYQSVEWKSVFLVAAMLPVGLAMSKTGLATSIGQFFVAIIGGGGPVALLAGLLILATGLTQVMSGPAVAVILAPIAIQTAEQIHSDPRAFALVVAYGCSLAFLSPLGHPANVLVMGPGGYKFSDYTRVGFGLTLILVTAILLLMSVLWGV
jgi:di/tricarboxylate transporter